MFTPSLLQDALATERSDGSEPASEIMKQYFHTCREADNLNQSLYVDMKTSLPDDLLALTDKMSMAASIECRAPFVDHELVELTSRMPSHLKVRGLSMKYLLKKAVRPWLPGEILRRKKRGFGVPIGAWLRRDLEGLVQETLSEDQVRKRGFFHWAAVQEMIARHKAQRSDCTDQLLALINFEFGAGFFWTEKIGSMPQRLKRRTRTWDESTIRLPSLPLSAESGGNSSFQYDSPPQPEAFGGGRKSGPLGTGAA